MSSREISQSRRNSCTASWPRPDMLACSQSASSAWSTECGTGDRRRRGRRTAVRAIQAHGDHTRVPATRLPKLQRPADNAQRRFTHGFQFSASYAWARLSGCNCERRSEPGSICGRVSSNAGRPGKLSTNVFRAAGGSVDPVEQRKWGSIQKPGFGVCCARNAVGGKERAVWTTSVVQKAQSRISQKNAISSDHF